jgi:four helix bundle protein
MITQFEELRVWQLSRELSKETYRVTRARPHFNDLALAGQMQRASVSIMSNIAEGFERNGKKEFLRFLFMAKGSCAELRSQLYLASDLNFIPIEDFNLLMDKAKILSRSLGALIKTIRSKLK